MYLVDTMGPSLLMGRPPLEKHTPWRYSTTLLNNSKGRLLAVAHTCTHTDTHIFFIVSPPVLTLTVHLPPSLSSLAISLNQPSVGTNLLYNSLWETALFLFKWKASLLSFLPLFCLLTSSQGQHLFLTHMFLSCLSLLVGEPSRSSGNGNYPQDLRGYFWTYICHGWEPRIPHKGWCEFPCTSGLKWIGWMKSAKHQ